jgi:hypothetical protein
MEKNLIISTEDEDGEFVIADDADESVLDSIAKLVIPK